MLAPLLTRHIPPASVMVTSSLVAAAGFALVITVGGSSSPALVAAATVLVSLGISPALTLSTDMIVGSAPPERAGSASALSETGTEFGGALGIALLGSLGTAVAGAQIGGAENVLVTGMHAAAAGAAIAMLGAALLAWRYLRPHAAAAAAVTPATTPSTA